MEHSRRSQFLRHRASRKRRPRETPETLLEQIEHYGSKCDGGRDMKRGRPSNESITSRILGKCIQRALPRLCRRHQCLWIRLTAASMWVKVTRLPCHIHAYTVYTSIGGKGRCHTRRDLKDHRTQARKSAGERSTPDLKPVRKDTRSPKQEQSVAPQTWPWSNKIF